MAHVVAPPTGGTISFPQGVTNGADTIIGSNTVDIIWAHGGDDLMKGGGGADFFDGGEGRDAVSYRDSSEGVRVNLQAGTGKGGTAEGDMIFQVEDVYGSNFGDKLTGDTHDNMLDGGDGNDVLKGGGGIDTLIGGKGDDIFEVDGLQDTVEGGAGIDTLVFETDVVVGMKVDLQEEWIKPLTFQHEWRNPHSFVYDVENVIGTQFRDKLYGDGAANTLMGGDGNDDLLGRGGKDVLEGGNGADLLDGGFGEDVLRGGAGADTFQYTNLIDSVWIAGKPADQIMDFQKGTDKIDLSDTGLVYADLTMQNNQMIDGVNYTYFGYDANDNGTFDIAEFCVAVKIAPGTTLSASDFLF